MSQLKDQERIRKELRTGMNEIDVAREYEEKVFQEKRSEMGTVIKILEEVKVTYAAKFRSNFMELQSETTVVQREVMAEISKVLQQHQKFKHLGAPFEEILAYMGQVKGANLGLLRNIIDLCGSMIKRVDETWQVERKGEEERANWYEKYKKLMGTDFKKHEQVYEQLKADVSSLKERIEELNGKMEDLKQRLGIKTEHRGDRYQECEEAAYDYAQRRSKRQEDRQVVSEVLGIVNVNIRSLKEEIALRMQAGALD